MIREELAAARKELRDSGIRLITTSKAYFVNPNMKAAQNNRESAIKVNFHQSRAKENTSHLRFRPRKSLKIYFRFENSRVGDIGIISIDLQS